MDPSKKRKAEENGIAAPLSETLTSEDACKLIEPFTQVQLVSILQDAVFRHPDVLSAVRSIADADPARRKLFVRGLGGETTTDSLRSLFSSYGDLEEAVVITDKTTGKSKGYGFVTFKHADGALLALKQPSKRIDGRMTVTHLAAAGMSSGGPNSEDVAARKIYVGNIPFELPAERLLDHFAVYGEIEEGPLGFDKHPGKLKGFAFFVYKTEEGAKASLIEPVKNIDGHQLVCKLAVDGKKGKLTTQNSVPGGEVGGERMGGLVTNSVPGSMNPQFGGPAMGSFGGYGTGTHQAPPLGLGHQVSMTSMGGPTLGSAVSPVPVGGYGGSGMGGGSYGGLQFGGTGTVRLDFRRSTSILHHRQLLKVHLGECIRECHPITEVYDSFLGAVAINGCGDFVIADNEMFRLIKWTAVHVLLLGVLACNFASNMMVWSQFTGLEFTHSTFLTSDTSNMMILYYGFLSTIILLIDERYDLPAL
ncbi:hypothetical protein Nepgr_007342 [Nepenthes gracilis]|uniref:RRM domain-containing protein n=1 Tax=Nepenthes gracilis TaxID=150966 RepID=A0AAD3XI71_NEPGR|nr:hypothetical protein Nepgr_007342 [Nepenthes gracilis]